MNKKIMVLFISIIAFMFLTAQSCYLDSSMFTTSEAASECTGVGDIVCDDTRAYECETVNGLTYTLYRASEYDVDECGATDDGDDGDDGDGDGETCTDCEVAQNYLDELLRQTGDLLAELQADLAQIGTSGWVIGDASLATIDVVQSYALTQTAAGDLSAISTEVTNVAADLAVFAADYPDEVAAIEAGILVDVEAELVAAQAALTNLETAVQDEFAVRWVPVLAQEVFTASVTDSASGATVPISTTYFWQDGGTAVNAMAELRMSGAFTTAGPAAIAPLMVGASSYYGGNWNGLNGEVVKFDYKDASGATKTLAAFLPEEHSSALVEDHMVYYVAVDGSTFYVEPDGLPNTYSALSAASSRVLLDYLAQPAR